VLDRPTQVIAAVNNAAVKSQTSFLYDDPNRTVTNTSDLNNYNDNLLKTQSVYDTLGRTFETRQYEGGTNYIATKREYDALGRAYKISNPYRPWQSETAVWLTTTFDALGRTLTATTADNAVVTTSYSGNAVTATDQAGKSRKSVTDALSRMKEIYEDPSGANYLSSYSYDVLDNLITVTQGVQTRSFVYDSLKRLTSASNPESGTTSFSYDYNGNLTQRVDARNITTTISYDALNRPTAKTYSDSTSRIDFYYDAQALPAGAPSFDRGFSLGALVAVTYGGGSAGTYRGYDAAGRVIRQYQLTDSVSYLTEASYFVGGAMQAETYPSVPGFGDRRTVSYTNDSAGRLALLNSNATSYAAVASVSSISYASHNGLSSETYGNSLVHAITYNNRLQPNEIKLGTSGNPTSTVSLVYSYGTTNNNGNVLSVTYNGGGLSYTQTFGYDALNRLTTSQENGGASWSQTNSYDRYGNRSIVGGGLSFNASSNRITSWSYDASGNLLNDGLHGYTFDGEHKIKNVDGNAAYIYDGEGQRVKKTVGENVRFVYGIGGKLVAEFDGSTGVLKKEYVYGASGLVATIVPNAQSGSGTQYTTTDNLGSPRVVTNSSAVVVSRHDYMPFGDEFGSGIGGRTIGMGYSVADGIRKKFTGYERDTETSLDYAQARYFSSAQGRFTSPDPLMASAKPVDPQSWNRYSYVGNNPMNFSDPSGMAARPGGRNISNWNGAMASEQASDGLSPWPNATADEAIQSDQQTQSQQTQQPQVVDLRKDKIITAAVQEIQQAAKPLDPSETPVLSDVRVIVGETSNIQNGSYINGYGDDATNFTGVVRPIAYVSLDQRGNIIEGNGIAVVENVKTISGEAPFISDKPAPTPKGGVFIDVQSLSSGKPTTTIQQAVFVGQFPHSGGPATTIFRTAVNEIVKNPSAGTVSVKIGTTSKVR
jgi:RHS repeat-associated protein